MFFLKFSNSLCVVLWFVWYLVVMVKMGPLLYRRRTVRQRGERGRGGEQGQGFVVTWTIGSGGFDNYSAAESVGTCEHSRRSTTLSVATHPQWTCAMRKCWWFIDPNSSHTFEPGTHGDPPSWSIRLCWNSAELEATGRWSKHPLESQGFTLDTFHKLNHRPEPQGSTRFLINVSSTLTFDDRYKEDKIEEFYLLKGVIDHLLSVT